MYFETLNNTLTILKFAVMLSVLKIIELHVYLS